MKVAPLFPQRTLLDWFEQSQKLDFNPSFQRKSNLWSRQKKQLLINSVLNQYDVPKFYLADFTYATSKIQTSKKPYAIIDGKQRLQAFFDFFQDKVKLGSTNIELNQAQLSLGGYKYSDLKREYPALALRYDQFVPTVMGVITDKEEEIEEMFIRLNTGVTISGPEKRNAMPGPLPRIIRRLSIHNFFREYATFKVERGQDLNVAAKLLAIEFFERLVPTYSKDLDSFVLSLKDKKPSSVEPAERRVVENLNRMTTVFFSGDRLLRGQAQLVTYYCFIKDLKTARLAKARSFLEEIENERVAVKRKAKLRGEQNLSKRDLELLTYNISFRSPDAPASQSDMLGLLQKRFSAW